MIGKLKTISDGLEIVNFDVNDITFSIWIRDKLLSINNDENLIYNIIKEDLRSWVLELDDVLKFIGINVPIIVILECVEDKYDIWHKIAGDQDWHRGDFAIIPSKSESDTNEIFEDVSAKAINFEKYTIQPINSDQISNYLYDEASSLLSTNKIEQKLHVMLIEKIADCLRINESTERVFDSWKSEIEKLIYSISSGGKSYE